MEASLSHTLLVGIVGIVVIVVIVGIVGIVGIVVIDAGMEASHKARQGAFR